MARVPEPNDGSLERSATKVSSASGDISRAGVVNVEC